MRSKGLDDSSDRILGFLVALDVGKRAMMCMLPILMQYTTTGSLWRKVSFSRRMNRASLLGVWWRPQAPSMNRLVLLGWLFF